MDWQSVCIIDNKDGRDITERVVSIEKDCSISRYRVVFDNSPKEFQYGFNRISYYDEPIPINVKDKLFFSKGKLQPEIKAILVFGEWCKIQYFDDVISTVPFTNLQYVRDKRSEKGISNIMDYLVEVSSIDDSRGLLSEEEPSFLGTQLRSMPVREDSALYAFSIQTHLSQAAFWDLSLLLFLQINRRLMQSKMLCRIIFL